MKVLKIGIIIFLLILISNTGSSLGSNNIREGNGLVGGGFNIPGFNIPGLIQNATKTVTKKSKDSKPVEPIPVVPIKSAYEIEKDIMIKYKNTPIGSTNLLIEGLYTLNPCSALYYLHDEPDKSRREVREVYLANKYTSKIFGIRDDDFINILNTKKNHPILDYMIHKDLIKLNKQILASNAKLPPEITKAMIERLVRDGEARLNKYKHEIVS